MSECMSTSLNVVSDAAVFCDCFSRSAMRSRMRFILTCPAVSLSCLQRPVSARHATYPPLVAIAKCELALLGRRRLCLAALVGGARR